MNLDEWNGRYSKILKCREDLRHNLFSAEFALAEGTIDDFITHMAERHGIEPLRQVAAQSINYRKADMRITPKALEWAKSVQLFTHFDNNSCFFSEFIVDMNPAILNAMAKGLECKAGTGGSTA